ncbi:SUMO-specific isopeptidase USPL1 isoform X2 [Corythoichthys intestinalis]|nr:SUMO-specific isopeptidase USPL1 isoform X2 [Corythoichthys intestinalis]
MARLVPAETVVVDKKRKLQLEDRDDSGEVQVKRLRPDALGADAESRPEVAVTRGERANGQSARCPSEENPPSPSSIMSTTEEDCNSLRKRGSALEDVNTNLKEPTESCVEEPVNDIFTESVDAHVGEPVVAPTQEELVNDCLKEPVDAPLEEPVVANVEQPVLTHIQQPVNTPIEESESLLEYNNLNNPQKALNPVLPIPTQEMHPLFWKAQEISADKPADVSVDEPVSLDNETNVTTTGTHEDVSIGSASLLDAFQGLSHDDIITLTLEEIQTEPAMDQEALPDCIPIPDSSSGIHKEPGEAKDGDFDPASEEAGKMSKEGSQVKRQPMRKCRIKPQELDAGDSQPPPPIVQMATHVPSTKPPPSIPDSRLSDMLSLLPDNQRRTANEPPPVPTAHVRSPPSYSTPVLLRTPAIPTPLCPKPHLLHAEDDAGLPLKAAETFRAFTSTVQSPPSLPKSTCRSSVNICGSDTDTLRRKLLKKLKAKKKKLAKLNQLLARQPDSTATISPVSMRSSVLSSTAPSPDSSGFLDGLAARREGTLDALPPQTDDFLDELLLTTATETQRAMENEALRELELFLS